MALDVPTVDAARRLIDVLHEDVFGFKIGLQFITGTFIEMVRGQEGVNALLELRSFFEETQGRLMWDNKFNDISNTLTGAMKALVPINPWAVTVHATSGRRAVEASVTSRNQSLVLGVTVLTSIENNEIRRVYGMNAEELVILYAHELVATGAQGVVCSPHELELLGKHDKLTDLIRVVPGIRPTWAQQGDQARVMTPKQAMDAKANYLVIGRPITQPPTEIGSPVEAAKRILAEIFG